VSVTGGAPERLIDGGSGAAVESVDGASVHFMRSEAGCYPLFEFGLLGVHRKKWLMQSAIARLAFVG
jgi:hypothetical protein